MAYKPNFGDPVVNFRFDIDTSSIEQATEFLEKESYAVDREIEKAIVESTRAEILSIFEEAMAIQSDDAFPLRYREHLRTVLARLPIKSSSSGREVLVDVDLDHIGTLPQLRKAFHRRARLKGGGILTGPWSGDESIFVNDAAERHVFFEAMINNEDYSPLNKTTGIRTSGKIKNLPDFSDTIDDYMAIWGTKAPYWRYLEFGQQQWNPTITPYGISEKFNRRFRDTAQKIYVAAWTAATDRANLYRTAGVNLADPRANANIAASKLRSKAGNPYKPGQFLRKV